MKYYKPCLEVTQLENKINQPETYKLKVDSPRENFKEFLKINRLILKSQQSFRSKKHDIFTEQVNKIALSSNGDQRLIQ